MNHEQDSSFNFRALNPGLGFHPSEKKPAPVRAVTPTRATPVRQTPEPQPRTFIQRQTPAPSPAETPVLALVPAEPGVRFAAYMIDSFMNLTLSLGGLVGVLLLLKISPRILLARDIVPFVITFASVFHWAIVLAQEVGFRTSFGKRLFGLRLNAPPAALFLRGFFFLISVGALGIGVLWTLIGPSHRGWHDLITDTVPVREPS